MAKDLVSELVNQDLAKEKEGKKKSIKEPEKKSYLNITVPAVLRQALRIRASRENRLMREIICEALWNCVDETDIAMAEEALQ